MRCFLLTFITFFFLFVVGCQNDSTETGPIGHPPKNSDGNIQPLSTPDGFTLEGTDTGGGGDPIVQDAYRVIQNIMYELERIESSDTSAASFFQQFSQISPQISIELYDRLTLSGKQVGAINYPTKGLIKISTDRWSTLTSERAKLSFIFHELMGLASINDPHDYSTSNRWGKILYRGVPDVCGRSLPILVSLEVTLDKQCSEITLPDLSSIVELKIFNYVHDIHLTPEDNKYSTAHTFLEEKVNSIRQRNLTPAKLWNLRYDDLKGLESIKSLDLSNANIVSIDEDSFSEQYQLVDLNLKNNHLSYLPESIFSENNRLEKIDLSANNFEGLPHRLGSNLQNLKTLILSKNSDLYFIDAVFFEGLRGLEELFMDELVSLARLQENIFGSLGNLRYLNLNSSNAYLYPGSFNGLHNLMTLELEDWNASSTSWNEGNHWQVERKEDFRWDQFNTLPEAIFYPLSKIQEISLRFSNANLSKEMFKNNKQLVSVCAPNSDPLSVTGCLNFLYQ